MKKISTFTLIIVSLALNCAPRDNVLKKIGDSGTYNKNAALINTATIEINSNDKYVWDLLVDVPHWPDWNPAIPDVIANGVTFKGDNFAWKWGKKVYTAVHYFDERKKLVWVSKSMAYSSVMVWEFEAISKNITKVTVTESRDGFFMNFISSKKHLGLLETWLKNLKNRSEIVKF